MEKNMSLTSTHASFQSECKRWRHLRKLSQLSLALEANISQRHLSYLETGRSQPSREMVLQLSEALDVPLRERNMLLQSAGYASVYKETHLDAPDMFPVMAALDSVLTHHNPLPALVVDRFWNVRLKNQSADRLLGLIASLSDAAQFSIIDGSLNIALLTVHPKGLRQFISNWQQAGPLFVKRLIREANASGDPDVQDKLREIIRLAGPIADEEQLTNALLPVMPLNLNIGGIQLSLFSIISTFGTPQDITTDELRIEAFYPSDQSTQAFFNHQDETNG